MSCRSAPPAGLDLGVVAPQQAGTPGRVNLHAQDVLVRHYVLGVDGDAKRSMVWRCASHHGIRSRPGARDEIDARLHAVAILALPEVEREEQRRADDGREQRVELERDVEQAGDGAGGQKYRRGPQEALAPATHDRLAPPQREEGREQPRVDDDVDDAGRQQRDGDRGETLLRPRACLAEAVAQHRRQAQRAGPGHEREHPEGEDVAGEAADGAARGDESVEAGDEDGRGGPCQQATSR